MHYVYLYESPGYGPFKVKASKKFTSTDAEELAIFFEFMPVDLEKVTKADNSGLVLMKKLEQMSIISQTNIDQLVRAMEEIGLQAKARGLQNDFLKIHTVENGDLQGRFFFFVSLDEKAHHTC